MKNFFKVVVGTLVNMVVLLGITSTATMEDGIYKYEPLRDLVYSNRFELKVYSQPIDKEEYIVGGIHYLWGIDRFGKVAKSDWSLISFNDENAYIKTSECITSFPDYAVESYNQDTVTSACANVYQLPSENSTWLGNIPQGEQIERILTLNNGWCMIKYNEQEAFIKNDSIKAKKLIDTFKITFYCPCSKCNGSYGPYDAKGNKLIPYQSIAVDPRIIPLGSKIHIEGMGDFTCVDTGSAIKGKKIDVCLETHSECYKRGIEYRNVYIYE